MNNQQEYFTVSEVALMLKIKKSYVYDLIAQNKLKAFRLSERRTRIPSSALEDFIERGMNNTVKLTSPSPLPIRWERKLKNGTN